MPSRVYSAVLGTVVVNAGEELGLFGSEGPFTYVIRDIIVAYQNLGVGEVGVRLGDLGVPTARIAWNCERLLASTSAMHVHWEGRQVVESGVLVTGYLTGSSGQATIRVSGYVLANP